MGNIEVNHQGPTPLLNKLNKSLNLYKQFSALLGSEDTFLEFDNKLRNVVAPPNTQGPKTHMH